jgi:hypothetical protein
MKILFVRKQRIFLRCFVIPRSSIPNKTKSQACSRKNSEKMVALFIPLVYKTVPKKFASEAIRIAQPATHQIRREKLERKSRTTILPARKSTARGQMSRSKNLQRKRWMPRLLHLSGFGAGPRRLATAALSEV